MNEFLVGLITGWALFLVVCYVIPEHIRPINERLVEVGMAYYDSKTGQVIWIKPIKDKQ